jgi:hypothetical protein
MLLSGRGLVVGSYVAFWEGVVVRNAFSLRVMLYGYVAFLWGVFGMQVCAFLVDCWWYAVMCHSGRGWW